MFFCWGQIFPQQNILIGPIKNYFFSLQPDTVKTTPLRIELIQPSFLGMPRRNFYGFDPPDTLEIIWKVYLGKGTTNLSSKQGERTWYGCGWTGQPLLIREDSGLFLIQGAYDHNLKKINAETGEIVWEYSFDDVIKGTGTLWINPDPQGDEDSVIIFQGSRLGNENHLYSHIVPSFRAISYSSGEELWRMNVKQTESYSRDVDGSGIIVDDTLYIGLENGLLAVINPHPSAAYLAQGILQPEIIAEFKLYSLEDVYKHAGNLVTESSISRLGNHLYIASGSGHVYGYSLTDDTLDWDFYIGSDIDGSPVVTEDSCLLISVEKQYINGPGGILKINPQVDPESCVVWFFPVGDYQYADWQGGVIGTCGINDYYRSNSQPYLACFMGIDGYIYVVKHQIIDSLSPPQLGPDNRTLYPLPELVYKYKIGPSISTPLIFEHKLIAAGYQGIYLFSYDHDLVFSLIHHLPIPCEATGVVFNNRLFIGSRDGYLYCLGKRVR